jgi:hypothetical protein
LKADLGKLKYIPVLLFDYLVQNYFITLTVSFSCVHENGFSEFLLNVPKTKGTVLLVGNVDVFALIQHLTMCF